VQQAAIGGMMLYGHFTKKGSDPEFSKKGSDPEF
jgi:hypothetical protein